MTSYAMRRRRWMRRSRGSRWIGIIWVICSSRWKMEDRRWRWRMADNTAPSTAAGRAAGTIYDLGYQHYTGPRYGRLHVIRTLTAFSFNAAFGKGRGSRAQLVPYIVMALLFLPAIVQIGMASAFGQPQLISYAQYLPAVTFFLALFTAAQAPEVIVARLQ